MKYLFSAVLAVFSFVCHGHLSGFTDTAIEVAQPGVRILYTLPADNLLELDPLTAGREQADIQPPEYYLPWVSRGWQVDARMRNCTQAQALSRELKEIQAYQFELIFLCPQGVDALDIRYLLFTEQWRGHQNFTRIFMADQQQRMRFAFDKSQLSIPVSDLLGQWQASLAETFSGLDPNRKFSRQDMGMGADGGTVESYSQWQEDPYFIWMGMLHIWEGADHLLFILALMLIPVTIKRLAWWVSLFTLAHSITLGLAYFGLFSVSPAITEPLVALTVAAIGVESLILLRQAQPNLRWRAWVIFLFGLIHGVGLSYQLSATSNGVPSLGRLLYFNLGVELGQLAVLLLLAVPFMLLRRGGYAARTSMALSVALTGTGLIWLVQRTLF
ncbi:hypothetical protein GCM10009092_43870 [Bowmanella denitrificans]|uniref:HupE/UreJ family protein n=1 Tax=Bowmanella denitrificans TaxID=366582 RepID=A0ABP3HNT5_9ALTE